MPNGQNPAQNQPNPDQSLDDVVNSYKGPSFEAAGAIGAGTTAYFAGQYTLQNLVLATGVASYSFLVSPFAAPFFLIGGAAVLGYLGGGIVDGIYRLGSKIKSAFSRTPQPEQPQPAPQPVRG